MPKDPLEDLEKIAHKHEVFLFALAQGAKRLALIYLMKCPKCGEHKLYFDTDAFICVGCGVKGSYQELVKMVSDSPADQKYPENPDAIDQ